MADSLTLLGRIFLSCMTLTLVTVFVVNGTSEDLNDRHVILHPPENVTAYFTGSSNVVVAWDAPATYVGHDVENATFDAEGGETVVASKHDISLIAVNTSDTSANLTESTNSTESSDDGTAVSSDSSPGESSTTAPTLAPGLAIKGEGWKWKCQPFSFFNNFTVEMKAVLEPTDRSMVVALKDSALTHRTTIPIKDGQKIVPFSKGCVTGYEVSWKERGYLTGSQAEPLQIPPTSRLANITGLKPRTTYGISVKAMYVSGDKLEAEKIIYVTTKAEDEPSTCMCDWHGSLNNTNECDATSGTSFCKCKKGYEGAFCERCSPGYYRTAPFFPCHRCPCSPDSTRTTTCRFVESFLRCDQCEVGYTGNICHQCDKGFYRFNRHCVQCMCNGNTPKNAENMCLATTGKCVNCQYNTTGFNCERCLPGYQGDAITYKNCTKIEDLLPHPLSSHKASSVSSGVVAAVIAIVVLVLLTVVAVLLFRRYRSKERRRAFWTIEMKRDQDDVDFNSVHNDDAHLDDDDMDYYAKHGQPSSNNKYARLHEDV